LRVEEVDVIETIDAKDGIGRRGLCDFREKGFNDGLRGVCQKSPNNDGAASTVQAEEVLDQTHVVESVNW
jgi:hypothetical protein